MRIRIASLSILASLLLARPACGQDATFTEVEMVPLSTLQLGEAAFVAPQLLRRLNIEPGQPAFIESEGGARRAVRLFAIPRDENSISLKRDLRDALGVEPGPANITLELTDEASTGLDPIRLDVHVLLSAGDPARWPGVVLGAPHADCDLYTGEIVELASEMSGIPAVTGWRGRISYMGRWIDVNRPLQRKPTETYGIEPDRSWTGEAEEVYREYRDGVLRVGSGQRRPAGSPPLSLYVDFHGHDLTVALPNGNRTGRTVVEGMTRGFSLEEVRRVRDLFDEAFRAEYGEETPPSYWGNLPGDRSYEFAGVETTFFYSGLGGRVYGALNSAIAERAVHIETPNVLRIPEENRPRTARALAAFVEAVHTEFGDPDFVAVPGGEFSMGSNRPEDWGSVKPAHPVALAPYRIQRTEVTNADFATFANRAVANGKATIEENTLRAKGGESWLLLGPAHPLARVQVVGGSLQPEPGFEDHPIASVTWYGATAYAEAMGGRLPTEAEWEYAAKWDPAAGQAFYWHEADDPEYMALRPGNYMHSPQREAGIINGTTTSAGTFPLGESPIGCADMAGNVWEWTSDWYGSYQKSQTILENPKGPADGSMKVIRGGAWDTEPSTTTPTFRLGVAPHAALPTLGFRIVLAASESDQ